METMDNNKTSAEVLLANLRLELLCPLCGELFRDPVFGPCGHTFCRTCANILQRASDQPECPECLKPLTKIQLNPNYMVACVVKHIRDCCSPDLHEESSEGISPHTRYVLAQVERTPIKYPRPPITKAGVDGALAGDNAVQEMADGKTEDKLMSTPAGRPSIPETVPESPEGLFSVMQDLAAVQEAPLPSSSDRSATANRTAPPVFNRAWVEHYMSGPLPTTQQCKSLELELAKLSHVIKEARQMLAVRHISCSQKSDGTASGGFLEGAPAEDVDKGEGAAAPGEGPESQTSLGLSRFDTKTIQRNADIDAALKARGFEMGETVEPMEEEKIVGLSLVGQKAGEKLISVGGDAKSKESPENMAEMEKRAAAVLSGRFSNSDSGDTPLKPGLDGQHVGLKDGGEGVMTKHDEAMSDMEMIGVEGLSNLQNFRFGGGDAGNVTTRGGRALRRNAVGRRGQCAAGNKGGSDLVGKGARVKKCMDAIDEEGGVKGAGRKGRKNPEAPQRRRNAVAGAKPRGGKKQKNACDLTKGTTEVDTKRGKGRGSRKRRAEWNSEQEGANGGKSASPPKKARRHRVVHKSVKKEEDGARQCRVVPVESQPGVGAGDGQGGSSQPGGEIIERVSARENTAAVDAEGGSGLTAVVGRKGKRRSTNGDSSSGSKRQRPIDLVGHCVEIFWDGMQCWYKGTVGEFCPKEKKYRVEYEDGEIHWEPLRNSQKGKRWRISTEENGNPSAEVGQPPVNSSAPKMIAVSDLSDERRATVRSFCESHGAILVDDVNSNTTHLVVGPVEGNRAKKRTEKLMRAVLHGCAIVRWGWIQASVKTGTWTSETEFLLQGDVKSKVDWRGVKMDRPLFTELQFAVEPSKGKLPSLVEELILIGGGCVLRKPAPKGEDAKFSIISVGHRTKKELRVIKAKWGKSAVRHEWIFDSVSAKSLLPQADYQS
ncbi:hypothetical protein BSKO_10713 [Bryopsis sp. KO-2023]|nr:hypothetical protein BSKO_10713 [Bryopsis sp. KO-2023]